MLDVSGSSSEVRFAEPPAAAARHRVGSPPRADDDDAEDATPWPTAYLQTCSGSRRLQAYQRHVDPCQGPLDDRRAECQFLPRSPCGMQRCLHMCSMRQAGWQAMAEAGR